MERIKVLFINNLYMDDGTATSATMRALLHENPSLEVFQLVTDPFAKAKLITDGICLVEGNSRLNYRMYKRRDDRDRTETAPQVEEKERGIRSRIGLIAKMEAYSVVDLMPIRMETSQIERIRAFEPQIIYTLAAEVTVLRLAHFLSQTLRIPVLIHNMDDIYGYRSPGGILRRLDEHVKRSLYRKEYRISACALAIGEKMADEYARKFSIPFDWAMNAVDKPGSNPYVRTNPVFRILFSGRLSDGRAYAIRKLAGIAAAVSVETQTSLEFAVYTGKRDLDMYSRFFDTGLVQLHPYVPRDRMQENLESADLLLHVESFEPDQAGYFRLSMSTKIPEYLAAGRAILCYGPKNVATVEYVGQHGIGWNAGSDGEAAAALREAVTNGALLKERADRALEQASLFTKPSMQEKVNRAIARSITHRSDT